MFGKIWKRAVRKEICNLGKIHGSVADNIFRSLNLHFIKMVDHATVKLFMKQRLKSRSGNGKCIADIADGQFFADMKFLRIKKSMAGESQVNDMTTRFGESFPMDLIAWNSFGW